MKKKDDVSARPFSDWCSPEQVFMTQYAALAIRLDRIGVKSVTIGLSGGLDSTLCLLVAVEAFKVLRLPRRAIKVYTMPGFGTTKRTKGNAERLCEGLGLKLETIDITKACLQHFKDIGQDPRKHDVTFENAQARMRTMILMDKANQTGGIVLGTGDMSEIALGWCTYNGDHMSMFGVNAGVPKTVVRDVCRWWAETAMAEGRKGEKLAAQAILDVLETPVSPELSGRKIGSVPTNCTISSFGIRWSAANGARRSALRRCGRSRGATRGRRSTGGWRSIAAASSRRRSSATARRMASRCFRPISDPMTGTFRPTRRIVAILCRWVVIRDQTSICQW